MKAKTLSSYPLDRDTKLMFQFQKNKIKCKMDNEQGPTV